MTQYSDQNYAQRNSLRDYKSEDGIETEQSLTMSEYIYQSGDKTLEGWMSPEVTTRQKTQKKHPPTQFEANLRQNKT